MEPIRRQSADLKYENAYVRVFDDKVRFLDGRDGSHLRIEQGKGLGAGAVAIGVSEGLLAMVLTFRYPLSVWQWGFARGWADPSDERDPERCAARELTEETGALPKSTKLLGWVTPDSGILSSRVAVVRVEVEQQAAEPIDRREVERVRWVSMEELAQEIAAGIVEDSFTLAGFALLTAQETPRSHSNSRELS